VYGKDIEVINGTADLKNITTILWDMNVNNWKRTPIICDKPKRIVAGVNNTFYVLCIVNSTSVVYEYNPDNNSSVEIIKHPYKIDIIASISINNRPIELYALASNPNDDCVLLRWDKNHTFQPFACGIGPNNDNVTSFSAMHFFIMKNDDGSMKSYHIVIGGTFALKRNGTTTYNLAEVEMMFTELDDPKLTLTIKDFCLGIMNSDSKIYSISGGPGSLLENEYIFVSGNFSVSFESQDSSQSIIIQNMAYCHVTSRQSKWYPCQDKSFNIGATSIGKIIPVQGMPTIPPFDFWQKNTLLFIIIGVLTLIMIVFGICCISSLPEKEDVMFETF